LKLRTTFTRYRKYLIPAVLAGSLVAGFAMAQGAMHGGFGRPSPEAMQRLQDGEIAGAVAALKMTDDQLKLWAPVEKMIRDHQAERLKMMQDHMAAMPEQGATPPAPTALPDRLDKMAEQMGKHAEQMKAFAATFKPFYASLSDAQKEVVGPLLGRLNGRGHGPGHGMGFGRWGHGHRGMMGDRAGEAAPPAPPAAPAQ
jgi:hypothetical protein